MLDRAFADDLDGSDFQCTEKSRARFSASGPAPRVLERPRENLVRFEIPAPSCRARTGRRPSRRGVAFSKFDGGGDGVRPSPDSNSAATTKNRRTRTGLSLASRGTKEAAGSSPRTPRPLRLAS
jgi:hypothetical protein